MNDYNSFCQSILYISKKDKRDIIQNIVSKEKKELLLYSDNTEGFCKYIANQILCSLQQVPGIRTFLIDLNELVSFDHVILISEYRNEDGIKRLLIDPTFAQFIFQKKRTLLKLSEWPSEKLKSTPFFEELKNNGIFEVNDISFKQYLAAFSNNYINISLSDYLMNKQFDTINQNRMK